MGYNVFSVDKYRAARTSYGVDMKKGVTRKAEEEARRTGKLSAIVDPAINPIRRSMIRLDPHQGKWMATIGCPMDIEVTCDTTGSMGGEVDTEMAVLPDLYSAVSKVLPGYDPQLCLGIFGDYCDDFVMCRPQFEMEAPKIVEYLKEMAPQRGGCGNHGEDPQYAMFARAYLTDAYTNKIGLKGYHFVITDEPYHDHLDPRQIERIFGENIFKNELKDMRGEVPTVKSMVKKLKEVTHQFVLVMRDYSYGDTVDLWTELCGENSVVIIDSTIQLPAVISAIIGLTEGTIDQAGIGEYLAGFGIHDNRLVNGLSVIDIGAQAKLRHYMKHAVPAAGDIFTEKTDVWPAIASANTEEKSEPVDGDHINYL